MLALSCMKSHRQSLRAGHICSLTQKALAGLSPALSLKPIKYRSAVESTIPGGVKHKHAAMLPQM